VRAAANGGRRLLAERYYAAVVPFDTVEDSITLDVIQARWRGGEASSGPLYVAADVSLLESVFGEGGGTPIAAEELRAALEADRTALGIVPFEDLDPRLKVLAVEGMNPLSNTLDPAYPLAARVVVDGPEAGAIAPVLAEVVAVPTNRDPSKLTTLIMTGVTAMARNTARVMEEEGVLYPALAISDTLAAADITHISNEIPFLENCVVNATLNNLVLCSSTRYWETLEAVGADIIGLSGNHVNDFGRKGARESLQFYADNDIPVYGSGLNIEEACKPLMWEHNGNTFAFIAALAYWPEHAWATETEPGACYYYDNKEQIKAMVQELAAEVDVVAVELQYYETYNPYPTIEQVKEFREVRGWGADIVTGVQSHVPQAQEPYGADDPGGPGMISYGLGNFFFDQMWSWETRTELYLRHAIYDGKLIGTEILTGVLENYAQPRWTTPKERADLLNRIFDAAPERPYANGTNCKIEPMRWPTHAVVKFVAENGIPMSAAGKMHAGEVITDAARRVAPALPRAIARWATSPSSGPFRGNRQRALPARRRHGRAAAAHRLGHRASGVGAAVAAPVGPVAPTRYPHSLSDGRARRRLSLGLGRLPVARWRRCDPRAHRRSAPGDDRSGAVHPRPAPH
jgi:poly-gamma-glutamate synthesis protein (capsule biosynthesis protein)